MAVAFLRPAERPIEPAGAGDAPFRLGLSGTRPTRGLKHTNIYKEQERSQNIKTLLEETEEELFRLEELSVHSRTKAEQTDAAE